MAGEGKGDNKLFQIVMVFVTTIIAPISVYFFTHMEQAPSATPAPPTGTLSSPAAPGTLTPTGEPLKTITAKPSLTAVPVRTSIPVGTSVPTIAAAAGILNPQGILQAGEVGIANGIAISVFASEIRLDDGIANLQIHIRNLSGQSQTFAYRVESILVRDTTWRPLEVFYWENWNACSKKDLSTDRKIVLAANQEVILRSVEFNENKNWCGKDETLILPLYQVTSSEPPKSIVIQMYGFGPFRGMGFQIDF